MERLKNIVLKLEKHRRHQIIITTGLVAVTYFPNAGILVLVVNMLWVWIE